NDELAGLEALPLCGLFGDSHSWGHSMPIRARAGRLHYGGGTTGGPARGLRSPPATGGGGVVGGLFRLRPMTRFCSHCFRVDLTPLYDGSSGAPRKNTLPTGSYGCGVCSLCASYNTFSSGIKAL